MVARLRAKCDQGCVTGADPARAVEDDPASLGLEASPSTPSATAQLVGPTSGDAAVPALAGRRKLVVEVVEPQLAGLAEACGPSAATGRNADLRKGFSTITAPLASAADTPVADAVGGSGGACRWRATEGPPPPA
jgi:hypothetical protein